MSAHGMTRRAAREQQVRNRLQHCVWASSDQPRRTSRSAFVCWLLAAFVGAYFGLQVILGVML